MKTLKIHSIILLFSALALTFNSCKKNPVPPVVLTTSVIGITQTTAISGGNVTDDGGAPVEERGVCWNTSSNPEISNYRTTETGESGLFTSNLSGLSPNTFYYIRAYATNQAGTGYGKELSFTTLPVLSIAITTNFITSINTKAAISGGNITDDGEVFITSRGVCWAETENPTIDNFITTDGTGKGYYNSYLTRLSPLTTYYVRAYATNDAGSEYGNQLSFTTTTAESKPVIFNMDLVYDSILDYDGNSYKTIKIGDQTWMAENLKCTKLQNGTEMMNVIDDQSWNSTTTASYCWYNNDISNKKVYGALYNWYAVSTEKLCPAGWHIPSHSEWITMIEQLGGQLEAGGKMKEVGTTHWLDPNAAASNESGFTGLPGGIRTVSGYFQLLGQSGRWWKSTEGDVVEVTYDTGDVETDIGCVYRRGLSVRCIKD